MSVQPVQHARFCGIACGPGRGSAEAGLGTGDGRVRGGNASDCLFVPSAAREMGGFNAACRGSCDRGTGAGPRTRRSSDVVAVLPCETSNRRGHGWVGLRRALGLVAAGALRASGRVDCVALPSCGPHGHAAGEPVCAHL
eukprot:6286101-Prymnesium_polylepis.1